MMKLEIICICLYKYKVKSLQHIISFLVYHNIEDCLIDYFVKITSEFELIVFRENCFCCLENLNEDNFKEKLIKGESFKHYMCKKCINKYNFVEYCQICDREHTL
jgi:hypothetical protein